VRKTKKWRKSLHIEKQTNQKLKQSVKNKEKWEKRIVSSRNKFKSKWDACQVSYKSSIAINYSPENASTPLKHSLPLNQR
jgi:hypothetical protein